MNSKNIYDYPKYYPLIFRKRNFKKESTLIKKILRKFSKIKIKNILDIACGTGDHMKELSKLGYNVAGLDLSNKMLDDTIKKMKNNSKFLGVYKKNMAEFILNQKFDSCICMINSLEILIKNKEFISHFNSVIKCLNKGGLYIIELDSPNMVYKGNYKTPKIYKRNIKRKGIKLNIIYKQYSLKKSIEKNELIISINDKNKKILLLDNAPIRRLNIKDILYFLKLTKHLELVKISGDLNLKKDLNDKSSKKMIIVLRRK